MKIPASSSLLIATLAVSSSSSALAAPSGEGHQESSVKSSQSGTALVSSTSSDMGPKQSRLVERDIAPNSIAERGLLDIPCSLVQTVTSIVPLPVIGDLLCSKGAKAGDGGSVDEDKVQAELSQLSNALTRVPVPLPTSALGALNNAPSAVSGMVPGMVPGNSSRAGEAGPPGNAIVSSNISDIYGSSSMASMSSTSLWRAQPTPVNSPSLPIDSSPSQSDSVSASAGSTNTTAV